MVPFIINILHIIYYLNTTLNIFFNSINIIFLLIDKMISSKFRNNKKNKEQDKEKMEKILSEYKIQRTNFNPNNRSPNIFMNN